MTPDYAGYRAFKNYLETLNLTPQEYEYQCREAAKRYGI